MPGEPESNCVGNGDVDVVKSVAAMDLVDWSNLDSPEDVYDASVNFVELMTNVSSSSLLILEICEADSVVVVESETRELEATVDPKASVENECEETGDVKLGAEDKLVSVDSGKTEVVEIPVEPIDGVFTFSEVSDLVLILVLVAEKSPLVSLMEDSKTDDWTALELE